VSARQAPRDSVHDDCWHCEHAGEGNAFGEPQVLSQGAAHWLHVQANAASSSAALVGTALSRHTSAIFSPPATSLQALQGCALPAPPPPSSPPASRTPPCPPRRCAPRSAPGARGRALGEPPPGARHPLRRASAAVASSHRRPRPTRRACRPQPWPWRARAPSSGRPCALPRRPDVALPRARHHDADLFAATTRPDPPPRTSQPAAEARPARRRHRLAAITGAKRVSRAEIGSGDNTLEQARSLTESFSPT
jgi:hypothetical protein